MAEKSTPELAAYFKYDRGWQCMAADSKLMVLFGLPAIIEGLRIELYDDRTWEIVDEHRKDT